jgi:hypothetical protein
MKHLLVLFCCCISLGVVRAEPCAPTAILTGDPIEVNAVSALLLKQGLSLQASAGCLSTKVRIIRVEKQILLEIEDSLGRSSRRLVSTYEAAATVIESWVYDATDDALFDHLFPKEDGQPLALSLSLDESLGRVLMESTSGLPPLPEQPSELLQLSSRTGIELSVLSEFTVTGGGSLWLGVLANASKKVGPLRLSLSAKYLRKSLLEISSTKTESPSTGECIAKDADGDGVADFFDCGTGCILLDVDLDGLLDDKQCQSAAIPCTTLDLNNDGTIDDFQCQELPKCTTLECIGAVPFAQFRNSYGLQAEVGLPFDFRKTTITPSIALGINRLFLQGVFTQAILQAETFLGFSRRLTENVSLEARISLSVTPRIPASEGQSAARLSIGLGWLK